MKSHIKAVPTLCILVVFILIFFSIPSTITAQNAPTNEEPQMGGADHYEVAESNFVDGFEDLSLNSTWNYIPYPRFGTPYVTFYARNPVSVIYVNNRLTQFTNASKFIEGGNGTGLGGITASFHQPVHNVSFVAAGVDGGTY